MPRGATSAGEPGRARRTAPRPGRAWAPARPARAARPRRTARLTALMSSAMSPSSVVDRRAHASTLSAARLTSDDSFMVRPTPRAAVVARPSVPVLTAFRPSSAPSTVAPNETAVCSFDSDACCCSRSTAASARRSRSASAACLGAYFLPHRVDRRVARGACASSCSRMRKSRSDSSGVRGELRASDARNSSSRSFCASHRRERLLPGGVLPRLRAAAGSGANARRRAGARSRQLVRQSIVQPSACGPIDLNRLVRDRRRRRARPAVVVDAERRDRRTLTRAAPSTPGA